jgi:hypothetical protein
LHNGAQEKLNKPSVRCTASAASSRSSNSGRRYEQTQTVISSALEATSTSLVFAAEDSG